VRFIFYFLHFRNFLSFSLKHDYRLCHVRLKTLNITTARKLIFSDRRNLSRTHERATGPVTWGRGSSGGSIQLFAIPAPRAAESGRTTMNFWLPHRNLGSTSRHLNRNPFARLLERSFILPCRFAVNGGCWGWEEERWNERQKRRVRAGDPGGGGW